MADEHKEEVNLSTEVANGGDVSGKADKKKNVRPRKDEKPIEEVFDLTKPIPKVSSGAEPIWVARERLAAMYAHL
jgi:hypothetical protein